MFSLFVSLILAMFVDGSPMATLLGKSWSSFWHYELLYLM